VLNVELREAGATTRHDGAPIATIPSHPIRTDARSIDGSAWRQTYVRMLERMAGRKAPNESLAADDEDDDEADEDEDDDDEELGMYLLMAESKSSIVRTYALIPRRPCTRKLDGVGPHVSTNR